MTMTMTMTSLSPSAAALRLFVVSTFLIRWGQGYIIPNVLSPQPSRSLWNGKRHRQTHPSTHTIINDLRQQKHHRQDSRAASISTTCLFGDLWERMNLMEDEEPMWYVLNCVAGNEMDLQKQCRNQFKYLNLDPADRDAIKFVVPTITSTRSHGAKRMVQDTKVKYQGYVFAHVRLAEPTYEALQAIPLMRSFMGGGINQQGFTKMPPAPIPLTYEEIEKYGLEDIAYTDEDVEAAVPTVNKDNLEIIVDTEELEQEEIATESAIEEVVQTVYNGLRVEDMIKVTAKNKFHGEDGTVRRLKDGKVKIRFFTYGQAYEEWLDPTDVRKMTDAEAMRGLTEGAPITQRDIDGGDDQGRGGGREGGRQEYSNRRNEVGNFGGGPRNRRQDRTASRYNDRKGDDGEDNWKSYQDKERRQDESGEYIEDGDFEIRGSKHRRDSRREGYSPESDVNSQWGRPPSQRQERRDRRERGDDRSTSRQSNRAPSRQENDDFFESLMADLSNDLEGDKEGRQDSQTGRSNQNNSNEEGGDDDDFFATLMSEISESDDKGSSNSDLSRKKNIGRDDGDDDDFFASLEREIQGTTSKSQVKKNNEASSPNEKLDDIFAELGINDENDKDATTTDFSDDSDDFFSSLEAELATELGSEPTSEKTSKGRASSDSDDDDGDDFFAKLDEELESDRKPSKSDSSNSSATNKSADVNSLTVPQLKEMLRERGLKVSGKKAELIERLNSLA